MQILGLTGTPTAFEVFRSWHNLRGPSGHSEFERERGQIWLAQRSLLSSIYFRKLYVCLVRGRYAPGSIAATMREVFVVLEGNAADVVEMMELVLVVLLPALFWRSG